MSFYVTTNSLKKDRKSVKILSQNKGKLSAFFVEKYHQNLSKIVCKSTLKNVRNFHQNQSKKDKKVCLQIGRKQQKILSKVS